MPERRERAPEERRLAHQQTLPGRYPGAMLAMARRLAVAFTALVVIGGCGSDDQVRDVAGKLRGPGQDVADHVSNAASAAKGKAPEYANTLKASATCLGKEVDARLGSEDIKALLATKGDLTNAPDELRNQAGKVRTAVAACVEIRPTLIAAFKGAGLDQTQAECVADQVMDDDKVLGPLLVNIVFGDPGVGTAIFLAVRATKGCVSAAELARLFPGR